MAPNYLFHLLPCSEVLGTLVDFLRMLWVNHSPPLTVTTTTLFDRSSLLGLAESDGAIMVEYGPSIELES